MRLWLIGGLIVLLVIAAMGYQALTAPSVSDNPIAETIFTYDLMIKNVVIVDGSGEDRQYGSIGILGDKITAVGPSISGLARRVVDGKGLYAAPGFVDLGVLSTPEKRKLLMGVTTQVVASVDASQFRATQLNTNIAWLVDQEGLVKRILGGTGAALTAVQSQEMGEKLSAALGSGSRGAYLTASSPITSLMRNDTIFWLALKTQRSRLFWQMPVGDPSVRDAVTGLLARSAAHQVPVHLGGVNLSHTSTWGRVYDIINLIDRSGSTTGDLVPYFEKPQVAERDLIVFASHPSISISSGTDTQHLAISGAYPRLLQRFVNQDPILSIEEAITKATLLPARTLGLQDRGLLRSGYFADIVLFDNGSVNAPSDLNTRPQGIHTVIVNGKIAVEAGRETDEKAGLLLAKNSEAIR